MTGGTVIRSIDGGQALLGIGPRLNRIRGYEHLLELMVAIRMEIGTKLREVTTA